MDTSRARANILARIRKAQGHAQTGADGAETAQARERRRAAESYLDQHSPAPQPAVGADLVAHFESQAQRMASTTDRVERMSDVPVAVAGFLGAHALPKRGVCWQTLAGLDWAGAGLDLDPRAPVDGDLVAVTGVFAAIAETGTLMLLSGPQTPASAHLLPDTHIAVVPASRIVGHYEDGFARMREEYGQPPRAMNLVSGPSRTGDIEQTIVLGAHGPYRVHVLIVERE